MAAKCAHMPAFEIIFNCRTLPQGTVSAGSCVPSQTPEAFESKQFRFDLSRYSQKKRTGSNLVREIYVVERFIREIYCKPGWD